MAATIGPGSVSTCLASKRTTYVQKVTCSCGCNDTTLACRWYDRCRSHQDPFKRKGSTLCTKLDLSCITSTSGTHRLAAFRTRTVSRHGGSHLAASIGLNDPTAHYHHATAVPWPAVIHPIRSSTQLHDDLVAGCLKPVKPPDRQQDSVRPCIPAASS